MVNKYYQTIDQYLVCLYAVKFLKSIIFKHLFYEVLKFFADTNLISKHQSGFCHVVICYFKSLMTTFLVFTVIYRERLGMFLDISKALDRVWHDGFLFEFKIIM